MKSVLSTKILGPSQKELLLHAGIGLVEYNAITIELLDVDIKTNFDHFVFTSQNGVKAFLNSHKDKDSFPYLQKPCFCVGEKTRSLLVKNGFNVLVAEPNAQTLAGVIVQKYGKKSFLFLSGNQRREELPQILGQNKVRLEEKMVYHIGYNPKRFDRNFDILLFFSPSAVISFMANNSVQKAKAFCIGETTAQETKKYTDNYMIARKPTIENVLVQVVKYVKTHD
ncbi:MAG: uroporphyrinogen-III synthase [Bacteroidota bacterium]